MPLVCVRPDMERWGFDTQDTGEPVSEERDDNLYAPSAHDGGARGCTWTGHTRGSSIYTWSMLHPMIGAACLCAGLAASALALRRL